MSTWAVFLYNAFVVGGAGYVVLGLGRSPWWFLVAALFIFSAEKKYK
jgi:hypothetical protein